MKFRIRMGRTIRVDSWHMVILRLYPRSLIYIPHTKGKSNMKLFRISGDPKPRRESFNGNLESGKKCNSTKVTITMVGNLLHTGHSTSICPIGQPRISSPVDPLFTLTLYWVHFAFWGLPALLQINIFHIDRLIGCGGKEYDYAFPLSTVE